MQISTNSRRVVAADILVTDYASAEDEVSALLSRINSLLVTEIQSLIIIIIIINYYQLLLISVLLVVDCRCLDVD